MTLLFQTLLIVFGLLLFFFIVVRIVKSKIIFTDFNYWLFFIAFLILLAAFPQLSKIISDVMGIHSETNTLFFIIIAILILLALNLSFRISQLNRKVIELTQKIAVTEHENEMKSVKSRKGE